MPPAIKDDGLFCLRLLGAELVLFCHQALFIAFDLDVQPVERALHVRHAFDQLLAQTGFSADKLNMLLITLEIKEIMKQLPGCMYVLERSSSHVGGVLP